MSVDKETAAAFEAARGLLRERMKFSGISQRDLAARIGLSESALSHRIRVDRLGGWFQLANGWPIARRILVQLLRDLADAHEREANRLSDHAEEKALRLLEEAHELMGRRKPGDDG